MCRLFPTHCEVVNLRFVYSIYSQLAVITAFVDCIYAFSDITLLVGSRNGIRPVKTDW